MNHKDKAIQIHNICKTILKNDANMETQRKRLDALSIQYQLSDGFKNHIKINILNI